MLVAVQILSSGDYQQITLTIVAAIRVALQILLPLKIYWLPSQPAFFGLKNTAEQLD